MKTTIAEFKDVWKTYRTSVWPGRGVSALSGVDFAIERGEVFALLGPNRAGKTTILKILLGLCRLSGGEVSRLGRPLHDRSTLARIGYMHENQAFPGYLTATALLEFYGRFSGVSRSALRTRIPERLARVGLADRCREPIDRFSKGMVQRLALAQATLADPELLVLDEPMEGLDLNARLVLEETVSERRDAGKTVLIVSHALGEVARVCDRVGVVVSGRIAYLGELEPLLHDSAHGLDRSLESALMPFYARDVA